MATDDIKEMRSLEATASDEVRDAKIMDLFKELSKLDPKDVQAIVVGVLVKPGVRKAGGPDRHAFMSALAGSVPDIMLVSMEVLKQVNKEVDRLDS